jgi:hypothetical protein
VGKDALKVRDNLEDDTRAEGLVWGRLEYDEKPIGMELIDTVQSERKKSHRQGER